MTFKLFRQQLDTIFDQKNIFTSKNMSHGFKAGLDYMLIVNTL